MTHKEYLDKLQSYQTSDATVEIRQKAINTLNEEYRAQGGAVTIALKEFEESKPDLSDWKAN